jgi:hypothetical protein
MTATDTSDCSVSRTICSFCCTDRRLRERTLLPLDSWPTTTSSCVPTYPPWALTQVPICSSWAHNQSLFPVRPCGQIHTLTIVAGTKPNSTRRRVVAGAGARGIAPANAGAYQDRYSKPCLCTEVGERVAKMQTGQAMTNNMPSGPRTYRAIAEPSTRARCPSHVCPTPSIGLL